MSQSRWSNEFKQHPFQAQWVSLKELLRAVEVDDQTIPTSVYELARLKRVVEYLDQILLTIDAELTPKAIWPSFHQQADALFQQVNAYASNKNIAHIVQANEHADNLLSYVRPYMVLPIDVLKALKGSANTYALELGNYIDAFREKSVLVSKQLAEDKAASTASLADIQLKKERTAEYFQKLFGDADQANSIQKDIDNLLVSSTANAQTIKDLHSSLFIGTPELESTQSVIKAAEKEIVGGSVKISALLGSVEGEVKQLDTFHEKIFGKREEISGKAVSGLEFELDARTTQLATLESEQNVKHDAMFLRIESLLPGATSAGLATAYKTLKDGFEKPIALYTKLFYGSLALLVVAAFVMAVRQLTIFPGFSISFVEVPEWDVIFRALVYKAPFVAPVIWLAIFSSTRRSQYERLQQEYAHKEALSSSYESYKKQLQDLKGDSDELQRSLIAKAIDCVAYNASATLDGKHEDKTPLHQFLEKFKPDELQKFMEMLRGAKSS